MMRPELDIHWALEEVSRAETSCGCCRTRKMDASQALTEVSSVGGPEAAPGADGFLDGELKLAALLLLWFQQLVDSSGLVNLILSAADSGNPAEIGIAMDTASQKLERMVESDDRREELLLLLLLLGGRGTEQVSMTQAILTDSPAAMRVLTGLRDHIAWFANRFFPRVIRPRLEAIIQKETTDLKQQNFREALETPVRRLLGESAFYWRMTANQHGARAFHYGTLRAMQERQVVLYKLVVTLDHRTSAICRRLVGKKFYVAAAVDFLERVASSSPLDTFIVAPWLTVQQALTLTNDELNALGVMVPPFHANCRTILVSVLA